MLTAKMNYMKKLLLTLLFIPGLIKLYAQEITPSPEFRYPEYTAEEAMKVENIPDLRLSKSLKSLPAYVDNSTLKYFPPVFNQRGNSCSQASGISYIFTYEMNGVRDLAASVNDRIYSYHYTWNFLNGGDENMGSWYYDGFELVMENGVPSRTDMNDEEVSAQTWMDGYEKYYRAMHNQIEGYYKILATAENGLEKMKQYLIDHGDGSGYGGLINFTAKTSNMTGSQYFGPKDTGLSFIIKKWGDGGDHAMTIVGYDDKVECDVDENGSIDEDEKGAFLCVNSWGTGWGDKGKFYMPYKLLYLGEWNGGIGNGDKYVYTLRAMDYQPELTFKVKLEYSSRNDLRFRLGVSDNATDENPKYIKTLKIFDQQGGDYYMRGGSTSSDKTIEIGLDASSLLKYVPDKENAAYFFTVLKGDQGESGSGKVLSFSVLDYRENVNYPDEIRSLQENVPIESQTVIKASKLSTGVDDFYEDIVEELKIYPNPVTEKAVIDFNLIQKENIKVYILDAKGRMVETLLQQKNVSGLQRIVWYPNCPKGFYLVCLQTDQFVLSKKIIVQ